MARVKKNETAMTLEEKLDQALVPDWEWPNKLPENWCWVRLGTLISSSKENTSNFSTDMKYVGLEHIEKDSGKIEYGSAENVKSQKNKFCAGQILYGKLRPYLNKHGIPTFDGVCSTDILVFDTQKITIAEYINFFFDTRDFLEYTISNSRGVNLPRVSEMTILEAKCPLAPLPEQQRIVDRIESLFAKLDEAKEKAQATLDSFEARKAAILHKAFTGELTVKWREENGVSLDEWEQLTLDDVADYKKGPFGSSITKAMFVPKGENTYKVYEQGNAIRKTLDYGSYYISQRKYEELKGFSIKPGDIIVSCAGTIGEIYKLPNNCEAGVINQALMRVRVYSNINEMYFIHYFTGVLKGDVIDEANGTAIKNIPPFKVLKAMNILLPSLFEQNEIVETLERMLSKEQYAKEAAETVIDQIEAMKKAILSRAFRGELGTNDPTEVSALELLKSILVDEKQETPDKPSKRRIVIPDEVAALLSSNLEKELIKVLYKEDGELVPMSKLMSVSSKKFEVIGAIKKLQQKGIIQKTDNGDFKLMR